MVKETTHRVVASIDHGKLFYNGTDMGSSLSVDVPDMAVIKLRAEPAAGYALAGWYEDGVQPRFQTDIEFQVLYSTTLTVKTEPSK